MAGGNQTRLGLVHQKPGTRRTLNGKYAVKPSSTNGDGKTDELLPTERLLEKAGALTQTMEQKLETATSGNSTSTTRTESIIAVEKIDSTVNEAEQDEQVEQGGELEAQGDNDAEPTNRDAQVQTDEIETLLEKKKRVEVEPPVEHHQAEEKSEDTVEDSVVPIQEGSPRKSVVRKEILKPVAKDTVQSAEDEDEDEDNIHPLARTVVKSTSHSIIHRRSHTDDTSNHDSIDKTHQPVNIPPKSLRKIVVQESTITTTLLPLPSHMNALFELFKGLDSVLEFTKRQGQLCFYHKIKRHVQLQSNRNFEIKNLAQLKTILPEGYKLTEAPCLFEGVKTRSILIDTPVLKDESEGNFVPENEKRRKLFMERLYNRIRSYHQTFLSSTTPHRTDTYPHEWHPDFDLETVTPVEESDIPLLKPTVVDTSKLDLKTLRRDVVKAPVKTPSVAQEAGPSTLLEKPQPVTAADFPPGAPVTKALSTLEQLKERIRQKQLEKKEQGRGMASPEEKRQALIASRLPAVFDLIRFKRVEVTPLKALTEQVVKSSRQPISEVEGRDSLEMMAKVLPEWCSVFATNDGVKYFKVIRDDGHGNRILHDERALRSRLVSKSTRTVGL
ncbi:replication licensing factor Cdt1 [Linnemannia zychae]|nr:replication licensing factor Cdt1 [Linnemannia zychae]